MPRSRASRKGFGGLMMFCIIVAITLAVFFILNALHVLSYVVAIQGTVNYVMQIDDNGTVMLSLMQAGTSKPYSEVFAELCTAGLTAGEIESLAAELEATMGALGKKIKVYGGSSLCYPKADITFMDSLKTAVALPGGRTGYMEVGE